MAQLIILFSQLIDEALICLSKELRNIFGNRQSEEWHRMNQIKKIFL